MSLRYYFIILAVMVCGGCGLAMAVTYGSNNVLFYAAEGLAVAAILFLILFYRHIMQPINTLTGGLDLLRAQDWNNRLLPVGQSEVDRIVNTFNDMMVRLKEQRIRYEERSRLVDLLVTAAPVGVVILDFDRRPIVINPAAEAVLQRYPRIKESISGMTPGQSTDLRVAGSHILRCSCHAFSDKGLQHTFYILHDISASVTDARREAYEKVIRVIAHEVNNTVGGLRSVFDMLSTILPDEAEDSRDILSSCSDRVSSLGQFISRYAEVVRIPGLQLIPMRTDEFITRCAPFLQSIGARAGVPVTIDCAEDCTVASIDPVLLEQVMVNIVKNAVESAATVDGARVVVSTYRRKGQACIEVIDNGAGISPEKAERLFTPFYTDKPDGQGIGLEFSRIILDRHSADYKLETSDADTLTRFTIIFP